MAKLFDFTIKNGAAGGFGMFSAAHFAWLAALLAAGGGVCLAYKKADENSRRVIRRAAAWGALGMELLRAALLFAAGEYNLGRLPLHLCAMAVYICALHAWRGGALTGQFLYAFCMPGAVFALIFPDWGYYPALHFMSASSFVIHGLIATYVVMQVAARDIVPDVKKCPQCLGLMLALALPVYIFDRITGTNYMFLNWPSPGSPLEWFAFLGSPGFVLGYLPILAAVWAVMYYPFRRTGENKKQ